MFVFVKRRCTNYNIALGKSCCTWSVKDGLLLKIKKYIFIYTS